MHPWVKGTLALLAMAAAGLLLVALGEVITLVVVSALLAYLLAPLVRGLEGRGLSRPVATTVVFTSVLLLVGLLLAVLWPSLLAQVRAVQGALTPARMAALIGAVEQWLATQLAFAGFEQISLADSLREALIGYARSVVTFVPGLLGLLTNLIVIPFLLFFFLKDGPAMRKSFIAWVPNRFFEFTLNLLYRMDRQLGNYLRGKLLATLVVGVLSTLALWGLGVASYLILGPLAGVLNLIPYVGPAVALVLTVAVAALGGAPLPTLLAIAGAYTIIQVIDNVVVNPLVVARNVSLHPVVVLLVVIVGGKFFGILGLLLAIPAAAVLKVAVQETVWGCRRYRLW